MELSEQSQLEAAIQASLHDCRASANAVNKSSKYELVFSESESDENDLISLSSDAKSDIMDETDRGWRDNTDIVDLSIDNDTQARTSTKEAGSIDSPLVVPVDADSEVRMKPVDVHDSEPLLQRDDEETQSKLTRNRKRTSSQSLMENEHPRKALRYNSSKMSDYSSLGRSQREKSRRSNDPITQRSTKKNSERSQTLTFNNNSANSVEELLESGTIEKHEVSHILFRLPDGSRLQKAFISSHPIKVMGGIFNVSYNIMAMCIILIFPLYRSCLIF